ncbi:Protein CBG27137 [Caenorhabditis briggsae]
MKFH